MKITKHEKRAAGKEFTCWLTGKPIAKGDFYWRTEGFYQGRPFQLKTAHPAGEKTNHTMMVNRSHEVWVKVFNKTINT